MPDQLQASCEIEPVRDSFIERCADIDDVADLLMSVIHQDLFFMDRSDRDHDGVCAVVVQMVVYSRTLDAAEI